jgi:hypothetical protein
MGDNYFGWWPIALLTIPFVIALAPSKQGVSAATQDIVDLIHRVGLEKIALNQSVDAFKRLVAIDFEKS